MTADQYAQVIVDVAGLPPLDYLVPQEMLVAVGDLVLVPVGRRKTAGLVVGLKPWTDIERRKLRAVSCVLNDFSPLPAEWLSWTHFAAEYYCRTWGEVALPGIPAFFRKKRGVRHEQSMQRLRSLPALPEKECPPEPSLNAEQQRAVQSVTGSKGFVPWLLYGVTGSGKTEVYLQIMKRILSQTGGAQALLLVPEINLTPQLVSRVRSHFPHDQIVTLNSELAPGERAQSWLAIHEGRARILVGTRLAVFASFHDLRLIVVDEEHDLSYKASDGARFSARDLAVKRAQDLQIPIVLGSATPSLESWELAKKGKYKLLELKQRAVPKASFPDLRLIELNKKTSEGLTEEVQREISQALLRKEQVLVFLNRRGYSPSLCCPSCGWISACPHCSAYMVFHKDIRRLVCHHCGYSRPVPERCPSCGAADIIPVGSGTQRIEEALSKLWPQARVLRIDRDSLKTKRETDKAFHEVHAGRVDILVGTQMISKGHDFKNVSLVVVLNSDAQLVSTDIRAKERLFSTLMQVSGRAGRAGGRSLVLVETRFPKDIVFSFLKKYDYPGFADALLKERREAGGPPFTYQAMFTADHEDLDQAMACLQKITEEGLQILKRDFQDSDIVLYDPVPMPLVKVANRNRAQLLEESSSRRRLHAFLKALPVPDFHNGNIVLEIDPVRF